MQSPRLNPAAPSFAIACSAACTSKTVKRCVDKAIRESGIKRLPKMSPPVAYSHLPTYMFTKGTDTGLSFQASPVVLLQGASFSLLLRRIED